MNYFTGLLCLASQILASEEFTNFQLSEEEVHGVYKTEIGQLGIIFTGRTNFLHVETLTGKLLVHFGSFREIDSKQRISCHCLHHQSGILSTQRRDP